MTLIDKEIDKEIDKNNIFKSKVVDDVIIKDNKVYFKYYNSGNNDNIEYICDLQDLPKLDVNKYDSLSNELYKMKIKVMSSTHEKDDEIYWRVNHDDNTNKLYIPLNSEYTDSEIIDEVDDEFLSTIDEKAYKIETMEMYTDSKDDPQKIYKRTLEEQSLMDIYEPSKDNKYQKYSNIKKDINEYAIETDTNDIGLLDNLNIMIALFIISVMFSSEDGTENIIYAYLIGCILLMFIGYIINNILLMTIPIISYLIIIHLLMIILTGSIGIIFDALMNYRKMVVMIKSIYKYIFKDNYEYKFTEIKKQK